HFTVRHLVRRSVLGAATEPSYSTQRWNAETTMRAQWPRHCPVVSAASLALRRARGGAWWFRAGRRLASRVGGRSGVRQRGERGGGPGPGREVRGGREVGGRRPGAGTAVGERGGAATGERGTAPAPRQGRGGEAGLRRLEGKKEKRCLRGGGASRSRP